MIREQFGDILLVNEQFLIINNSQLKIFNGKQDIFLNRYQGSAMPVGGIG